MLEIKTILLHILPYIPFVSAAVVKPEGDGSGVGVVITRLVEAGIIGAVILYANLQVLEQKFADIKEDMAQNRRDIAYVKKEVENAHRQLNMVTWKLDSLVDVYKDKGHLDR